MVKYEPIILQNVEVAGQQSKGCESLQQNTTAEIVFHLRIITHYQ
jgi:hypothetical protein